MTVQYNVDPNYERLVDVSQGVSEWILVDFHSLNSPSLLIHSEVGSFNPARESWERWNLPRGVGAELRPAADVFVRFFMLRNIIWQQ